jgi:hypothetical protein
MNRCDSCGGPLVWTGGREMCPRVTCSAYTGARPQRDGGDASPARVVRARRGRRTSKRERRAARIEFMRRELRELMGPDTRATP